MMSVRTRAQRAEKHAGRKAATMYRARYTSTVAGALDVVLGITACNCRTRSRAARVSVDVKRTSTTSPAAHVVCRAEQGARATSVSVSALKGRQSQKGGVSQAG